MVHMFEYAGRTESIRLPNRLIRILDNSSEKTSPPNQKPGLWLEQQK